MLTPQHPSPAVEEPRAALGIRGKGDSVPRQRTCANVKQFVDYFKELGDTVLPVRLAFFKLLLRARQRCLSHTRLTLEQHRYELHRPVDVDFLQKV